MFRVALCKSLSEQMKSFRKRIFKMLFSLILLIGIVKLSKTEDENNRSSLQTELELTKEDVASGTLQSVPQNDSRILNYIRTHHLIPPSTGSYSLSEVVEYENLVVPHVLKLLKNKSDGFFVECGANDGEFMSNSLALEKLGWTGLLVEADPVLFEKLWGRNRKAWKANVCLPTVPYPLQVTMIRHNSEELGDNGQNKLREIVMYPGSKEFTATFTQQCFPLYSILSAMNISTVDYFSLDIEGAEYDVLKSFPFDGNILIKVISVEDNKRVKLGSENESLSDFMKSKGYVVSKFSEDQRGWVYDSVFVHNMMSDIM